MHILFVKSSERLTVFHSLFLNNGSSLKRLDGETGNYSLVEGIILSGLKIKKSVESYLQTKHVIYDHRLLTWVGYYIECVKNWNKFRTFGSSHY